MEATENSRRLSKFVFVDAIISFALSKKEADKKPEVPFVGASEDEAVPFRPEDLMEHFGPQRAEAMAAVARSFIEKERGRKCKKNAPAFVKQAITESINNSRANDVGDVIIFKKRKGYNRVEYTFINDRFLFQHKTSNGN